MNTSNFNNPLAQGFNPLNPLASNPLGGGPNNTATKAVAMPAVEQVKLEEQLPLPTEFKNIYIERLCKCPELTDELDKFETMKIKMRNRCIQIINILN